MIAVYRYWYSLFFSFIVTYSTVGTCVGRYFVNFAGTEPGEEDLAQTTRRIRNLTVEERAVRTHEVLTR